MKVIDPGHVFQLDTLDNSLPESESHVVRPPLFFRLQFVKRVGSKYPGNRPPSHGGTTMQEVLRVLIDRTKYVDAQIDMTDEVRRDGHMYNRRALEDMRSALRAFEMRAALERGDSKAVVAISQTPCIELTPTCAGCGHVFCNRSHP